ncbi:MAG: S41 family peptidase [Aquificaceae bacterium]|nr:S41 family peptidase [Aquificaceae bacterium]
MRKLKLPALFVVVFIIGFILGSSNTSHAQREDEFRYFRLLSDVLRLVKENYVENVSNKELIYGALNGVMKSLDPFSSFFTPEQYNEFRQETAGEFGGVGIELGMEKSRPVVISPIEGTPAFKAGVRSGDVILEVDGEDTSNMTISDVVKRIRGKPGTKVTLTILRKGSDRPIKLTLERAIIKIESAKWTTIDNFGYIKLSQFTEGVSRDVERALRDFNSRGVRGVILDLRNDPGGLLTEAIAVSDLFLQTGKLIVYTKTRKGEITRYSSTRRPVISEEIPVVVLINKGSASASEIVAGALQDNKRATIIGEKSFGKASVQNIIPLEDGSAIKITVAYYYTPSGRLIQKRGIEPDLNIPMDPSQDEKLHEMIRQRRLEGQGGVILIPDADPQLKRALEVLKSQNKRYANTGS